MRRSRYIQSVYSWWLKGRAPAHGGTHSAWEKLRRRRISGPKSISVTIEASKVALEGDAAARVSFVQVYRSDTYSDRTDKTLELVILARDASGSWSVSNIRGGATSAGAG